MGRLKWLRRHLPSKEVWPPPLRPAQPQVLAGGACARLLGRGIALGRPPIVAWAMEGGPRDAPASGSVGHSGGGTPSGRLRRPWTTVKHKER